MVLVTGGTGYIGSHTVVELIESGYEVVIADNLCNSKIEVLDYIKEITGVMPTFRQIDVCDEAALTQLFDDYKIDSVIHFAGLKAVGESCRLPLMKASESRSNTTQTTSFPHSFFARL